MKDDYPGFPHQRQRTELNGSDLEISTEQLRNLTQDTFSSSATARTCRDVASPTLSRRLPADGPVMARHFSSYAKSNRKACEMTPRTTRFLKLFLHVYFARSTFGCLSAKCGSCFKRRKMESTWKQLPHLKVGSKTHISLFPFKNYSMIRISLGLMHKYCSRPKRINSLLATPDYVKRELDQFPIN